MKNEIKTILFASLIVALILPFSGMTNAYAELSDTQKQRLIDKLEKLEERIQSTTNDSLKERLESRQQVILERLFDDIDIEKLSQAEISETVDEEISTSASVAASSSTIFNTYGRHSGCDGGIQIGNFKGDYTSGSTQISITQYFPSPLTSGNSPNCEEHTWGDNVYINIANVWDNSGCVGNMDVDAVQNYPLNCAVLGGFYVLKVTADYDGEQLGLWTWFWA